MPGGPDVSRRVFEVLESADGPLSTGQIQRRIAADGLDVATRAIRDACERLREDDEIEVVGDDSRRTYRLAT